MKYKSLIKTLIFILCIVFVNCALSQDQNLITGKNAYKAKNYQEAFNYLSTAINTSPNAEAFFYRGLVNQKLDKNTEAEQDFQQAVNLNFRAPEAYLYLGITQNNNSRFAEAINNLTTFVQKKCCNLQAFSALCKAYLNLSQFDKATIYADSVLAIDPNNEKIIFYKAICELRQNNFENSKSLFDRKLALNAGDPLAHKFRGELLFKTNKFEEAKTDFKYVLDVDNQDVEALQFLLAISDKLKDKDARATYKNRLLALGVKDESISLMNAYDLTEKGDKKQARKVLDEILASSKNIDAFLLKAKLFMDEKKWKDALETIETALKEFPDNNELLFMKGEIFYQKEDYKAGIEIFKQLVEKVNKGKNVNYMMGLGYFKTDADELAFQFLKNAIEQDNTHAQSYSLLAMVYLKHKNDTTSAITTLEKALQLDPNNQTALATKGDLYFGKGEWLNAIEAYNEVSKFIPNEPSVLNNLAIAYWRNGQPDLAKQKFEALLVVAGKKAKYYNNFGQFYYSNKRYDDAEIVLNQALLIDSTNFQTINFLVLCKSQKGDYHSALLYAKRIPETEFEKRTDFFYNLGLLYLNLDEYEKAIKIFKKIVDAKPTYEQAWSSMGLCQINTNDTKAALESLKKAQSLNPNDVSNFVNLGICYNKLEKFNDAEKELEIAVEKDPKNKEAHFALGYANFMTGKNTSSCKHMKIALQLNHSKAADFVSKHCM